MIIDNRRPTLTEMQKIITIRIITIVLIRVSQVLNREKYQNMPESEKKKRSQKESAFADQALVLCIHLRIRKLITLRFRNSRITVYFHNHDSPRVFLF